MGFGSEFVNELGKRGPELALGILAGLQGPQALGGFQYGVAQSRDRAEALARQTQLDEERRAQQSEMAARAQRDDARADEQLRMQRLQAALTAFDRVGSGLAETATDPGAAENQLLSRSVGLENAFGLKPGQLSPFIPNMTPTITRGIRADARQLLSDARDAMKQYEGAVVDDATTTFKWENASPRLQSYLRQAGHPDGQGFKPSQIEAIVGTVDITIPNQNRVTYGELFPAARGTAQGSIAVPTDNGRIDLNEASNVAVRMGWVADRTNAKQVKDAAIEALRDRLRYVMRNPTIGGTGASAIARQFTALGLDSQVEIDKAAREIAAEHLDRARSLDLLGPNAEVPTPEQIRQGFTLATDPVVRGRALDNIQQVLPGPVGTRQPVPNAVYDFVPGQGLVPSR